MGKSEQIELEVLIAIRNNQNIPVDEFYKIFDCNWPIYRMSMGDLYNKGLLIITRHEIIPGLNRLQLTGTGKCREMELLQELSNDLSKILSEPKKTKKSRTFVQKASSLKSFPV
jgi:hypothetical protein